MESLRRIGGTIDGPALKPGEHLLGPTFAHTSVGLAIADLQGHFVEANSGFLTIVGRTLEQLSRETILSITFEEDRSIKIEGIRSLLAGEKPDFLQQKRYCRPDGSLVWVRNTISLLRDSHGKPVYTLAICEDIDTRRRAEEASLQAKEAFELATRAADLGVWDMNVLTGEFDCSARCHEIFGFPEGQPLTLKDFIERMHPEERERVTTLVERSLDPALREIFVAEYGIVRPSGERRWAAGHGKAYFAPVPGGHGEERAVRFVGTISDVTDRRRSVEALIQAEKLAATGRLAASIAHEINNPLASVINLLYLLRREEDPEQRSTYLAIAEQEISRVSEISTQTLRFYRDPSGPTICDIPGILHSVLTLFHGRMNLLQVEPKTCFVENTSVLGSQGELRQVFVNLIGNALDAMPTGGRLLVHARPGLSAATARPGIRVTIADTGEGMDRATVARIFEPFFTTKKATGTGLGLWLSLEILLKHNASIRVRSAPGHGTVVTMFLPFVDASELHR